MSARGPAWEALGGAGACTEPADAYEAGIADERERGMRRAAKPTALLYWETVRVWCLTGRRWKHYDRAAVRCHRIARGEPAFTTPRAFGGKDASR